MANIVPFEGGNLPAYLKNSVNASDDLAAHAGTGFPVISIKGKVFAIVRDGERSIIKNPKDPESPATNIDVVIVKANKGTSKVYYAEGYTEGSEGKKPTCFSNDGVKPDAMVERPQAASCMTCPQNVWGSKVSDSGKKIKACSDSVRLAVAAPNLVNDPMLVRVPPASIRTLGEYGQLLKKRGVEYQAVLTKISFDMEEPTPKLVFKPVGFLPEATYREVLEVANSDAVQAIVGTAGLTASEGAAPIPATPSKDKQVTEEEVAAAMAKATVEKVAKKPTAKPAKSQAEEVDVNLDELSFDD